ncbi:protein FAM102A-like protein [Anopheles sinensis]|uniref:Protein FAM102A-like protein n=1 Tax=Anopheles sinensis TaxID=74873 RepID=A0A084W3H8_ANOSI|nr:protein FAM102A-like protein [Anopheles sinensis]
MDITLLVTTGGVPTETKRRSRPDEMLEENSSNDPDRPTGHEKTTRLNTAFTRCETLRDINAHVP